MWRFYGINIPFRFWSVCRISRFIRLVLWLMLNRTSVRMKTLVFTSIPGLELNTTPFQPPMGRSKHAIVSWPKIGHGRLWRPIFVFCLFSLMEKVKSVFLIKKLENWNNRNGILWSNGNKGLLLENLEFQICLLLKTAKIRLFLYAAIWPSARLFFFKFLFRLDHMGPKD